jgi:hypothetical protein
VILQGVRFSCSCRRATGSDVDADAAIVLPEVVDADAPAAGGRCGGGHGLSGGGHGLSGGGGGGGGDGGDGGDSGDSGDDAAALRWAWWWLHADDTRIKQIVVNLVNNAIKFTPRGGRVDLLLEVRVGASAPAAGDVLASSSSSSSSSPSSPLPSSRLSSSSSSPPRASSPSSSAASSSPASPWRRPRKPVSLCVEVRDTGIGINEQSRKNLFKAFMQARAGVRAQL